MWLLTVVTFICVGGLFSSGDVSNLNSSRSDLLVLRQQIDILTKLIDSECPNYIEKRVIESDNHSIQIKVARELYTRLAKKYAECTKNKSINVTNSTASTKADTTTNVEATTITAPDHHYRDCQDYYEKGFRKSGVHKVKLSNGNLPAFKVWCDFINNHGWTVIQRRGNLSVRFNRTWNAYKYGFGDIDEEYWLGNERIHHLTKTNQRLNILITPKGGDNSGIWKKFVISNESDNYRLTIDKSGYTGDLWDGFSWRHNGMAFSTRDKDNDQSRGGNCAAQMKGGWWYNNCAEVDLNQGYFAGMYWSGVEYPIRRSVMRVTRD